MYKLNFDDTIVAISTVIGESGIGIVRMSGSKAIEIADKIFLSRDSRKPSQYRSFTIHYGYIVDGSPCGKRLPAGKAGLAVNSVRNFSLRDDLETSNGVNGKRIIDEVLLSVMHTPRTYTKEDIVEINCHGGVVPLRRILDLAIKEGARLAAPGEFTLRAFINGRIDLSQAEAVLDIIKARTDKSLELAYQQLEGKLSHLIKIFNIRLMDVLTQLEAEIDFPEDDLKFSAYKKLAGEIKGIKAEIEQLLNTAQKGIILKEGIYVVICGRSNTGKSSLMNILLNKDRCLVTPLAGTTRDAIEEFANIQGIPLRLVDTAGISKPRNLIEKASVERSQSCLKLADLVLLMFDGSRKFTKKDEEIIRMLKDKTKIVLVNKIDLPQKLRMRQLNKILPGKTILRISCITRKGINELEKTIGDFILKGKAASLEGATVTNLRHKNALLKAGFALEKALEAFKNRLLPEFIVLDLRESLNYLGEILGENPAEELLDKIFSQFCVGK